MFLFTKLQLLFLLLFYKDTIVRFTFILQRYNWHFYFYFIKIQLAFSLLLSLSFLKFLWKSVFKPLACCKENGQMIGVGEVDFFSLSQ